MSVDSTDLLESPNPTVGKPAAPDVAQSKLGATKLFVRNVWRGAANTVTKRVVPLVANTLVTQRLIPLVAGAVVGGGTRAGLVSVASQVSGSLTFLALAVPVVLGTGIGAVFSVVSTALARRTQTAEQREKNDKWVAKACKTGFKWALVGSIIGVSGADRIYAEPLVPAETPFPWKPETTSIPLKQAATSVSVTPKMTYTLHP